MCELIDEYADFFDIAGIIPVVVPFVAAADKTVNKKVKKNINKRVIPHTGNQTDSGTYSQAIQRC